MSKMSKDKLLNRNQCSCIPEETEQDRTMNDFLEIGNESFWEAARQEAEGDYWNEREKKMLELQNNYKVKSWDYPLSPLNRSHPCTVSSMADKILLDKLSEVKSGMHNDLKSSSCICGYASSIDKCPKCLKLFGCEHGDCKLRPVETDPDVPNMSTELKFSCGEICLTRIAIRVKPDSDMQKRVEKHARNEVKRQKRIEKENRSSSRASSAGVADDTSVAQRVANQTPKKVSENIILGILNGSGLGRGRPHELSPGRLSLNHNPFEKCSEVSLKVTKEEKGKRESLELGAIGSSSPTSDGKKSYIGRGRGRRLDFTFERSLQDSISESSSKPSEKQLKSLKQKEIIEDKSFTSFKSAAENKVTRSKSQSPNLSKLPVGMDSNEKYLESLRGKLINKYLNAPKLENLLPGPTAEDLMKYKDALHVTHFYSYNKVHLVNSEAFTDHILLLKEDIYYQITTEDGRKSFEEPPEVNSVLLAPLDGHYARASVESIYHDLIKVFFFDIGGRTNISYKECLQIGKDLLTVPILGLIVELKDVTDSKTDLILASDFETFIKMWPKNRPCMMKSYEIVTNRAIVDVQYNKDGGSTSLSTQICNLGKWEWERRVEKTAGIDEAFLCDESNWNPDYYKSHLRYLPHDTYTSVTVVSRNLEIGELVVHFNVIEEAYYRDREVLKNQLLRYFKYFPDEKNIYPALQETVWVNICPEKCEERKLDNLRGINKWSRCIRQDDILVNLDEYEFYPLKEFGNDMFKIRTYCPDFAKVPFGVMTCYLKEFLLEDENKEMFEMLSEPGSELSLKATDPEGDRVTCKDYFDMYSITDSTGETKEILNG